MAAGVALAESTCKTRAKAILDATGVKGGLVVHVGCGDGSLTAALRANDRYIVHGLDVDPAKVDLARKRIGSMGVCGKVSVDRLTGGRLPYVDNLVNLIVAEDLGAISMGEVMRVLAPHGVAYVKVGGAWKKTIKPRPEAIDEWTHFLYDATNNAVSSDRVVGPPRQLQWVGGPRWARSHDHLGSVSAAVSSAGRLFYIVDEGPIAAVVLEPKWSLVARDAFSGVILWKRPIARWQWHLRGFRSGPSDIARRLVAVGDRVYVTLGIDAPVSALDACTGQTIRTYKETESTLEMVCCEGTLFVVAGRLDDEQAKAKARRRGQRRGFGEVRSQRPHYPDPPPLKRILAFEAATGRQLWKKRDADTRELMPTTLAVSGGKVFFQNAEEILCIDARSGNQVWRAKRPVSRRRPAWSAPTLVVSSDVVLSGDRAVQERSAQAPDDGRKVEWTCTSAGGQAPVGELIAFSAKTGKELWRCECKECYNAPVDVLVADGLVWTGSLVRAKEPGVTEGRDPKTGKVERTRPKDQKFFQPGMGHGRCYRNRGTNRYLVLGRSGVEFIDLATGEGIPHHWTRGTCQLGVLPCNGLLYAPSNSCACFITAKLDGFNCLAPRRKTPSVTAGEHPRLEKGPAYREGGTEGAAGGERTGDDWPCYRCDPTRSGFAKTAVPAGLRRSWLTDLGGRISTVVVAGGKVLVARVDAHTVHALDVGDGRKLWSYTAGGRVDSPPTIWRGLVLFGAADGWVYCLRASDGALAWRFRAAPADVRIVAYGQVESAWPVHGSVLVQDGVVTCVAGRSSYLDGGIRLCRLDAKTGKLLSETPIDHRDPETGYQRKGCVKGTNIPGALPDVLSSDGTSVFLRHLRFDLSGQPVAEDVPHLFSSTGFLDDSWWHRTYWLVGTKMGTNYGGWPRSGWRAPAGRLLALDASYAYGFGRSQYHHTGSHVGVDSATVFHFRPAQDGGQGTTYYQAFAYPRKAPGEKGPAPKAKRRGRRAPPPKKYLWTRKIPILARAIVLAKDHLFLAGPPDILTTDDPIGALEGAKGGTLMVLSASGGQQLATYPLESPPVFDGMAAAGGALYMTTTDGNVLCFRGSK